LRIIRGKVMFVNIHLYYKKIVLKTKNFINIYRFL